MPSTDSADATESTTRENAPIDEYFEDGPSPAFVVAFGLSVMAFSTFVALNQLPNANNGDGGLVAFGLTLPFFFGGYLAARGFFVGMGKVTATDD
ncbi:hypothetical protein [Halogranum rubrum]|uniref:Uncharacterized protein n=1 Tax=Halogranum salarium B-1 TaxID=1210908 RepID=J2ZFG5_9EURY|nr:hypothetical protein [Halogranum salarium]EJN59435.1 hypothetical protein HSB1_15930 [Halogranum salarium B-1]